NTRRYVNTHTHTQTRNYTHTHTHTHKHTVVLQNTRRYVNTHTHCNTRMHARTHAHTHTHTPTHTQRCNTTERHMILFCYTICLSVDHSLKPVRHGRYSAART